jgi:AcrR family transcriptional regulator
MGSETKSSSESPLAPRKAPTQKRAQSTVESILQATEELVRDLGFEKVGTRQIAERAGISIGSLYQYFPTYESILLAWYEKVAASAARKMKLATIAILDRSLDDSVRITLKALLKVFEQNALTLIRMPREVVEIERAMRLTSFEYLNRAAMRLYFAQHHEFNPRDTERHIFFLESIIMSILRRYVMEKPRHLKRAEVLEQVALLVSSYLKNNLQQSAAGSPSQRRT